MTGNVYFLYPKAHGAPHPEAAALTVMTAGFIVLARRCGAMTPKLAMSTPSSGARTPTRNEHPGSIVVLPGHNLGGCAMTVRLTVALIDQWQCEH